MAKRGRKPILDDQKRARVIAILRVGCSRRMAAEYVHCSPSTIQNTADRDPAFAEQLRKAGVQSQLAFLKNIRDAAKKEQYWRAAAWALERLNPHDFGPPKPGAPSIDEFIAMLDQLAEIVVEEVPVARHRTRLLRRIDKLIVELRKRDEGMV